MKEQSGFQPPKLRRLAIGLVALFLSSALIPLGLAVFPDASRVFFGGPQLSRSEVVSLVVSTVLVVGAVCLGLSGLREQVGTLITDEGIAQRRLLRGEKSILWSEVKSVEESLWVIVINSSSEELRILPQFFHNPPSVLEAIMERLSVHHPKWVPPTSG